MADPLPERAARRDRARLTTLALVTTVGAVVSSLGAPLVPSIAEQYDVSVPAAQWALTATLLAGAVATPVLGRLGSGRRRRPTVLAGIGVVLLGTLLAALPLGYGPLVVGRALQGVGLALVPLALAVARDAYRGAEQARALALLSVTTVAGAGLGYPVTSLIAEYAGLHGAYVFGAVLVTITLLRALRHLPADLDIPGQPVDLVGAAGITTGTLALLLTVSQGRVWGWTSPATVTLAVVGVVAMAAWVRWTLRHEHPLVDLRLAARPGVVGPHVVALVLGIGMYGLLSLSVVIVRADGAPGFGLDLGVGVAGFVLVPYSIASVAGSQAARAVDRRWGNRLLLPLGCSSFAASLALLAWQHDHLWQLLVAMALGGLGSGFSFSSLAGLIVPHVPSAETGSAIAFNQLLRYLGFSIGSASSVVLLEVYGGDAAALRDTLLTLATICVVTAVASATRRRTLV
ncbi:MFS transporter [Nocardioides sp.]|uniref:MFS transporter n=1 Tax=Nocardioides sp. TaxID=35761 RepID=UPI002726E334|nr:MFS transporter [Nocardioides sp.]MDO9455931.1 MFS transporter [Nocardioides sp.]